MTNSALVLNSRVSFRDMDKQNSNTENFWEYLSNSRLIRYLLLFGSAWVTILLINYFYSTIALFTAAGIFAALLNYPVAWLSRYIPRGFGDRDYLYGRPSLNVGIGHRHRTPGS